MKKLYKIPDELIIELENSMRKIDNMLLEYKENNDAELKEKIGVEKQNLHNIEMKKYYQKFEKFIYENL